MGHTGTLRMIVLLGAVIKSAKPYIFSKVHTYVHKVSQWFKYLYNMCMGAFRTCHRVALCKCARETVHSYTKPKITTVSQKKKTFLNFENQVLHGFSKENIPTFCKKQPLHGFKKTNTLHGFTKWEATYFSKKKTSGKFWKKNEACMVFQNKRVHPCA